MPNYLPCRNPSCKLFGRPHPNCKDYDNLSTPQLQGLEAQGYELPGVYRGGRKAMAHGGLACEGCGQGYAIGGEVEAPHKFVENPSVTVAHAAAQHGLLGLMKNVGRANLADPDKHKETLDSARMAGGLSADDLQGSPLVGPVGKSDLAPIVNRMSSPAMENEPHPEAFRSSVDYLHSAMKGKDALDSRLGDFMNNAKMRSTADPVQRNELQSHLDAINQNPASALDIGGDLGHYLPTHSTEISALSAGAINYLNSIKPMKAQSGPMDPVVPPSKLSQMKYNRALDIANDPLSIIAHAKNGTIQSQDVQALGAMYPKLGQVIVQKATEALMDTDKKLSREQKRGLGMLVGQSMNFTETPLSAQAIMKANMGPQYQPPVRPGRGPKKATKMAVEQGEKQAKMMATDSQARQMEKKE
jgi:hypothetical protein